MLTIDSNCTISMNRGDTADIPIFINITQDKLNLVRYTLTENDVVYVCVAEPLQKWEDALIKKVYTINDLNENGDIVLHLDVLDTEYLAPGTYRYEVKLVTYDNRFAEDRVIVSVSTVVPRKKFIIVE